MQYVITVFKLWNNCMNHNFNMTTNTEFHGRITRQSNLISEDTHNLSHVKEKSKIYLINVDEDYYPISPFVFNIECIYV